MSDPIAPAVIQWRGGESCALLIHGITSSAQMWWRLAPDLVSRGYSVVAPDLRGHGATPSGDDMSLESYRDDVLALGDGWDLVVGHSLGGAIALMALAARPGWTHRLVLEDPALVIPDAAEAMVQFTAPWRTPIERDVIAAANPRWHARDVDLKVDALRRCGEAVVIRTVEDSAPWDTRPLFDSLTVPTLLLGADPELGALVSPEFGQAIAGAHPSVEFVTVVGGSHSMHRDSYDEFWAIVGRFLAEPDP